MNETFWKSTVVITNIKNCSEIQENINDEFRSNFEQIDVIKTDVTSLKNKHTEHEKEITKVREDLSVAINQKFTSVSERVSMEVELSYFSNESRGGEPHTVFKLYKKFQQI